jgi:hypothetical protein
MTSVFEVLSNKETQAKDDLVMATDQKHQSTIQTNKQNELTSRKYFMICQTCFWCASCIDIMHDMNALHYKACPTCDHTAIELLQLSNGEHYRFEYTATPWSCFGIYMKNLIYYLAASSSCNDQFTSLCI